MLALMERYIICGIDPACDPGKRVNISYWDENGFKFYSRMNHSTHESESYYLFTQEFKQLMINLMFQRNENSIPIFIYCERPFVRVVNKHKVTGIELLRVVECMKSIAISEGIINWNEISPSEWRKCFGIKHGEGTTKLKSDAIELVGSWGINPTGNKERRGDAAESILIGKAGVLKETGQI